MNDITEPIAKEPPVSANQLLKGFEQAMNEHLCKEKRSINLVVDEMKATPEQVLQSIRQGESNVDAFYITLHHDNNWETRFYSVFFRVTPLTEATRKQLSRLDSDPTLTQEERLQRCFSYDSRDYYHVLSINQFFIAFEVYKEFAILEKPFDLKTRCQWINWVQQYRDQRIKEEIRNAFPFVYVA